MSDADHLHELNAVAVHLALLKTGKVILFSGDHKQIWNWNKGESSLWDPNNQHERKDPELKRNLFCSGHCYLPDGRLFVAGGQSTFNHPATIPLSILGILQPFVNAADHDIHTFDPIEEKWTYHTKMPKARWYPTCVTLPDGKALIVSGTSSHAHHAVFGGFMNLDYEIFDPSTNTLSKPVKFIDKIKMYPFLQVLPGGTLFVHSEKTTNFWNITQKKFIPDSTFHTKTSGTRTYPGMGSCVLLPLEPDCDTAKILLVGGSMSMKPDKKTDATKIPEIFTVNLNDPANSPGWKETSPHLQRFLCDSILLPDGTVLVTNGAAKGQADDNQVGVSEIELFDPKNEHDPWDVVAYLEIDRLYHGSAILLPDGKVLVAGSTGHNWIRATFSPQKHFEQKIEIITPPKLKYNPTRPEISNVPPSVSYESSFEVFTSDAQKIKKVSLIRVSSTTHNNNMDQRCLFLTITDQTSNTLKLKSPKDSTYAPPGYYLLFLLDKNDIPSIGEFIKVG